MDHQIAHVLRQLPVCLVCQQRLDLCFFCRRGLVICREHLALQGCRGSLCGGIPEDHADLARFNTAGFLRGQLGQNHMPGLAALVNAADVVCIAVLFQRRLYDRALQLPVVQVAVFQLADVNNFGVLFHVLAVVDDLGESAAGDFVAIAILVIPTGVIIQCARQVKFFIFIGDSTIIDSTVIIAIDDGRVAFAKVGGTVCVVADAVGRDILVHKVVSLCDIVISINGSHGTNRSTGAFSINVCVDNGIASAAVDVDVTSTATVTFHLSANCRSGLAGSIIWVGRIIRTIGVDRIYGAAGNVDGCCGALGASIISDCGAAIGTDSCNVGILFNIDREITAEMLSGTDGAAILCGFCMYGGISGNRNRSGATVAYIQATIANGSAVLTVSIHNGVIFNGDAVSAAVTAADRSALLRSGSNMGIALNADVTASTTGSAAAANAGTAIISTNGSDIAAGDGNVGCITKVCRTTAADRSALLVAACQQLAGSVRLGTGLWLAIIVHIVLDGQGAGAVYVCFFNTGVF